VAFTSANPFTYPDDDVFGYMRAQRDQDGGTLTRISPLKCSPLVAVIDQAPVDDFGVMARQRDGDPVPFEHQFYSVVLKGIFSLDLGSVGVFSEVSRTGYKNLDARYVAKSEIQHAIQSSGAVRNGDGSWQLPRALRLQRVREALAVLPYLSGGAKLTLHLTDVTPKLIVLSVIDGGNHLFMNIAREDDQRSINTAALHQAISDYRAVIVSDVFIGRQEGFQDALAPDLSRLAEDLRPIKAVHLASPKQAIEHFVAGLDRFVE
jgi:CRISPR-associated protein Cst2